MLRDKLKDHWNKWDMKESLSFSKDLIDEVSRDQERIGVFLSTKDIAPWFRGTSVFHLEGANRLFNAIRDDTEQSTSHRVRACLNLLGLDPIISSKEIKFLMRLSRGNDLAFLWFLMELHYHTTKPGYSVNEQLICSAICHLDMITTLRELDKILPESHKRKPRKKTKKDEELKPPTVGTPKFKTKKMYILPYFERQRKPKLYGKPLVLKLPNFSVDVNIYKPYTDPNYVVANESNRWYANYQFQTSKRIANHIIRDEIEGIFKNFETAKLKASQIEVICDYHKTLKELEEKMNAELHVKLRDECLLKYFGSLKKHEERAEEMKKKLEKEIEKQMEEFRKEARIVRKQMTLKTLTSECELIDVILGEEHEQICKKTAEELRTKKKCEIALDNCKNNNDEVRRNSISNKQGHTKEALEELDAMSILSKEQLINVEHFNPRTSLRSSRGSIRRVSHVSNVSNFASAYVRPFDYGHICVTPTESQTFFQAPKDHKPFSFDYRKIFEFNDKPSPEENRLKDAFLDALDEDISNLTKLQKSNVDIEETAKKCAEKIWYESVRERLDRDAAELLQRKSHGKPLLQYPDHAYYNARDKVLMEQMLIDAFEYLRKNPKFVWAQLPEAHKVPMLREWIARRYGKIYTTQERWRSYKVSLKIFQALYTLDMSVPPPTAAQLGHNMFLSYNCRDYVDKKGQVIKNDYNRRLNENIMEQSRVFWFAMRGHLCSGGPPRNTFFAYMPSRFRDIQRFRLWKPNEYRNYKGAWERRKNSKKSL
uniref:DUF4771 domain-containing protein n=1 Tax=Glossina brevipalpis TaxID=37001 RepID=A0A1A9WIQ2_9MUSC